MTYATFTRLPIFDGRTTCFHFNKLLRCAALASVAFILGATTANASSIQIMPMGDSITVGVDYYTNSSGGYRDPLYQDLTAAGIGFTFVGTNTSGSTTSLTAAGQTSHNGYGGWHIQDLNSNLDGVASPIDGGDNNLGGYLLTGAHGTGRSAATPDILLLEVGTNDLLQGSTTINQDLHTLVTHIHSLTPNTIILIAGVTPINGPGWTAVISSYNSYIKNTLVPSLSYTRFVDQNTSFLNSDGSVDGALLGSDNIHPNRFGYPVLAINWAAAIESLEGITPPAHTLTVSNGTGSGSFPAGSVVTINATPAAANSQFSSWMPSTTALSNPFSSLTTYVMPAQNATIVANYAASGSPIIPNGTYNIVSYYDGLSIAAAGTSSQSPAQQQTYTALPTQKWDLTNLGGNVVSLLLNGTREALEVPATSAGTTGAALDVYTYGGSTNQQWTITPDLGTTQLVDNANGLSIDVGGYATNSGAPLVQYTTSYVSNELWAFYPAAGAPVTYDLTVNNGTGGGYYAPGSSVTVTANAAPTGFQFSDWIESTTGLANPAAATTTFTMPAQTASVSAVYKASLAAIALTVNNGSGNGAYVPGSIVTVTANAAPAGSQFAGWIGTIGALANPSASTTRLTMPSTPVIITATYTPIAVAKATTTLTVNRGTGSGTYAVGTAVNVTANPAARGMAFAGWTGHTRGLANASAPSTTYIVSKSAATIRATYAPTTKTKTTTTTPISTVVTTQFESGSASPRLPN